MSKSSFQIESSTKVTVLVLSWRDIKAPKMGGAEIFTHEMLSKANDIRAIHFSPMFQDAAEREEIDSVLYFRAGGTMSVIRKAKQFYKNNKDHIDFVIDQCNTHRFFSKFWVSSEKRIFLIFQLTREIWGYMAKFPLSIVGRIFETPMLKLNKNDHTITMSQSTKDDLIHIGFIPNRIKVIPPGLSFERAAFDQLEKKDAGPVFIYVGRYAVYKGIDIAVKAFCMLKSEYPQAKLWLVGKRDNDYIQKILKPICDSYKVTMGEPEKNCDVTIWGFVSEKIKLHLMGKAKALLFPSIREGWGMIVTEAAAVGTPSIVFDSPGIRDAVDFGQAGYVCKANDCEHIYALMKQSIAKETEYESIRQNAYDFSGQFLWEKTAQEFEQYVMDLYNDSKERIR